MKVKLTKSCDWERLEIDGELYYENHIIDSEVWINLLNECTDLYTDIIIEENEE